MKVFVPVMDSVVGGRQSELNGRLVPFSPEFLVPRKDGNANKPRNWIRDYDYVSACKRLSAGSGVSHGVVTA